VVAVLLVLTLRRPFSAPSPRTRARRLRKHPDESIGTAPAFPTPPLPAERSTPSAGASKEKVRG
ncbi:MAG TPA: NADH-quinone oxidoreductase subunit H, partial [Mycobacterium sp.]